MKNKENQQLRDIDLIILLSLMIITFLTYGSYSRHIFSSEKISSDQLKAEILAYQAAQIFLLKSVEKSPGKSRSIASESGPMDVSIGEDSNGKPFRFRVSQDGRDNYRVILSSEAESSNDSSDAAGATLNLKIDMSAQPET